MLDRKIEAAGGLRAWSREVGISPAHISRISRLDGDVGDVILDALGLDRIVTYRRKNGAVAQ